MWADKKKDNLAVSAILLYKKIHFFHNHLIFHTYDVKINHLIQNPAYFTTPVAVFQDA